ncbi:unnamed protein product [Trichobilharzia szidati]|nr:unnamed protein product [Trichobilharzia szidati]
MIQILPPIKGTWIPMEFKINITDNKMLLLPKHSSTKFNIRTKLIRTDSGYSFRSEKLTDTFEIPLSTCAQTITYKVFGLQKQTQPTNFMIKPEYLPEVQNLRITIPDDTNARTVHLNWTLNTANNKLVCPFKTYAFVESENKRLEYETLHNHFDISCLESSKLFKIGVIVKSAQNTTVSRMVQLDYSTCELY